jgi:hypothetical protein
MESERCHFLFYVMIRHEINCCICSSRFSVYLLEVSCVSVLLSGQDNLRSRILRKWGRFDIMYIVYVVTNGV